VERVQRFTRKTLHTAALVVCFLEKLGLFGHSSKSVGLCDRYVFPISRAVDRVASGLIGKNLIAVARVICPQS
jgi:hypothetical protein